MIDLVRPRLAAVALVCAGLFGVTPTGAASAAETVHHLTARAGHGTASPPHVVILDALPEITSADADAHPAGHRPADGMTEAQHRALKARAARLGAVAHAAMQAGPPFRISPLTQSAAHHFAGITEGCTKNPAGAAPALAVGPTYVLEVVNSCIALYTKAGVLQTGYPKSLNKFLGLPANADTHEPRALYDWVNNRYVVVVNYFNGSNNGAIYVAASQSKDPTAGWWISPYQLTSAGFTTSFPTLGQDRGLLYIGTNLFSASGGALGDFVTSEVIFLPKSAIYTGSSGSYSLYTHFQDNGDEIDSIQPANVQDPTDNPRAEYLVATPNITASFCEQGCSGIIVWAVSNPYNVAGTPGPELSAVIVPTATTYALPPNAPQLGTADAIDTGDTRISGTVSYAAGQLYGTLTTRNNAGTSSVLAFQIHPTLEDGAAKCTGSYAGFCPNIIAATMVNEDCFYCDGQNNGVGYSFYGTQQPDPEGNVTMIYQYSDANNYPFAGYTSRRVSQAVNTYHDAGLVLAFGKAAYHQGFWGPYTAAAIDVSPLGKPLMWYTGMQARSNGTWGTEIGASDYLTPNQP